MIGTINIPISVELLADIEMGIKSEPMIANAVIVIAHIALMTEQPDGSTTISIDSGEVNTPLSLSEVLIEIERNTK